MIVLSTGKNAWEAFEHSDLVLSVPFNLACAIPAMIVTYELRNDRVWGRHWLARQVPLSDTLNRVPQRKRSPDYEESSNENVLKFQ